MRKSEKVIWIINQYASTPTTGMGGRHYYMARELAKQGYKVYVITSSSHHLLHTKPVLQKEFLKDKISDRTYFIWMNLPLYKSAHSKQRILNWLLFAWRLKNLPKVIDDKPDAILCSSPSLLSFVGAQRLSKKMSARLVFEVRDIWPLTLTKIGGFSPKHPFIRLMSQVERRAYRDSDAIISNLKNAVEHMTACGMENGKFTWISNGFSLDEVSQKVTLNPNCASQIPHDKFIVGYAGTLGVANALDVLIDAAEKLKGKLDIAFVLAGTGKEKAMLQSKAKERGLNSVYFIDPVPKVQVQALLAKFDACYIGWHNEELYRYGIAANKIFDYLYSAKPIIHAYSGACDPVTEANAGIRVDAEASGAVAEAVLQLYDMSPKERDIIGANGRRAAIRHYEYGELAEKLSGVLFKQ